MLKTFLQDTKLLLLLLGVLLLKAFSLQPSWVEKYYTYGLYPVVGRMQRILFGWLPFSFGDLLYACAVLFLFHAAWRLFLLIRNRQLKGRIRNILYRVMKAALWIYFIFNILWGLNYNRLGIAYQLGLSNTRYSADEVRELTTILQQRLNDVAATLDTTQRKDMNRRRYLEQAGRLSYGQAGKELSFLQLKSSSFKRSLYSPFAHFIGFTGYFNPFTGEAQVASAIPEFLQPFVSCHEIAHQLGYGRENEANFVGFLAARESGNQHVAYSVYFEMYRYALRDLARIDTTAAKASRRQLHQRVLRDNEVLKAYFEKTKNPVEPLSAAFYDRFLKLNSQSQGLRTYNEVVGLLIAYQKKYGKENL